MNTNKMLFWLGVFFYSLLPLIIVVQQHLRYDDGGYRFDIVGIVLAGVVLYLAVFKKMKHRVNVWDVQGVHKEKVITFRCLQGITFMFLLYLVMKNVAIHIDDLLYTLSAIIVSMLIGWVLELSSVLLSP